MIDSDAIRELIKASFGGDRSAAGRYAAQQRWKNQTKKVKEIAPSLIEKDKKMFDDVVKRLMNESTLADLYFGASPSWYRQLFFVDRMELISKDPEVHNAKSINKLISALLKYEEPTENEKQNATKLGRNLSELSKPATSLRRQLHANPYVTEDELKKKYADEIIYDIANSWSQDPSYVTSMAMKLAVQDELGLSTEGKKEPKVIQDQLDAIREGVMNGPSVFYPTVLRKAVRAIYDATQERIKATMENGTTHIRLYRGTKVDLEGSESQGLIRSLTSWTPLVESAKKFEAERRGGQPIVLVADVPIKQIFATRMLGFGHDFEKEVVVLGPKVDVVRTLDFTVKDLGKASFDGDRSAAGRYAAEQRWKGHQKKVAMLETNAYSHPWESGAISRISNRLVKTASLAELYFAANHAQFNRAFYADRMKLIKNDEAVKNAKTYDELFAALSKYDTPTKAEEASLPANSLFNRSTFTKHLKFDYNRFENLAQYKQECATSVLEYAANYWKMDSNHPESLNLRVAILQEFGESIEGKEEPPALKKELAKAEKQMQTALFAFYTPTMKKFVRAMYEETQESLKSKLPEGTTHVRLFRGTSDKTESPAKEGMLRRLTSWTTDPEITRQFKGNSRGKSVFITAEIPVKQIFATFSEGLGSYTEQEVLVLGPKVDVVAVGDNTERRSISAAEADSIYKASFGGDRSAAGRYAAEQRWKNHRKKDEGGKGRSERREKFSANLKRVQALVAEAEAATAKDSVGNYSSLNTFSPIVKPEQMESSVALYDDVKGLTLVRMMIPQQKTKGGELRTVIPQWSNEEMLKLTTVFVPSPEAMALEQEVQRVGLEALAIAEEELTAQGVTEKSVEEERSAKHSEINAVTFEAQQILNVYNVSGYSEPNYSLVDEATAQLSKETRAAQGAFFAADRAELVARNAFAEASRGGQERSIVEQKEREYLEAKETTGKTQEAFLLLQEKLRRSQYQNPDLNRLASEEMALRKELAEIKSYTERRYEVIQGLLREERRFGDVEPDLRESGSYGSADKITADTAASVKKYIPSQIIDLVNQQGSITVLSNALHSGGGYWNGPQRHLMTGERPQVQLHEYIHAITEVNPVAKLIEQATAARRTIGSPATQKDGKFDSADLMAGRQKVSKSTRYQGMKYDFDHVKDNFAEPYAGRLYDHISGEVLTVGHDLVFTDDRTREFGIARRDDDLSASTIGLLFTLGSGNT